MDLCSSVCQEHNLTKFSNWSPVCLCKRESSTYWKQATSLWSVFWMKRVILLSCVPEKSQGFRMWAFAKKKKKSASTFERLISENTFSYFYIDFLFVYRNIISNGLSQHNKYMERRGIIWLYQSQKQKVILHTMNLYILENLKCQSSWFTYSVSTVIYCSLQQELYFASHSFKKLQMSVELTSKLTSEN